MFANIGAKIKGFAKLITWIGIIVSLLCAIGIWTTQIGTTFGTGGARIFTGIMILVLGSLVSWISSWLLYAYGELVENIAAIRKNTEK